MHKKDQLFTTPAIGQGNRIETATAALLANGLPESKNDSYMVRHTEIQGFWVLLGGAFHAWMSARTKRGLKYASSSARDSFPAKMLQKSMVSSVLNGARDGRVATIVSPQNMLMEALAEAIDIEDISIEHLVLALLYPDVAGKFESKSVQHLMHHFVWNRFAHDLIREHLSEDRVHLIKPLDPRELFPVPPESKRVSQRCIIKLSGSGGDASLVSAACKQLENLGINPEVSTSHKLTQQRLRRLPLLTTEQEYYEKVQLVDDLLLLTYPSEQIKFAALLSSSEDQTVSIIFLPPRGAHEIRNLAWGLAEGLSQIILCKRAEHLNILDALLPVLRKMYPERYRSISFQLVDPSEISTNHFQKAQAWLPEDDAEPFNAVLQKINNQHNQISTYTP